MATSSEFGSLRHLVGRFAGSLRPGGPPPPEEAWARAHLLPGEAALWARLSGPDRRHALGVAQRTIELLGGAGAPEPVQRDVVAAALLHDVGKVEAGLGTWARAAVTAAAMASSREQLLTWARRPGGAGLRRRVGLYLTHDRVGAALLEAAGSAPVTVAWAGEHHRPAERWSVEGTVGTALKAADDD